MRGSLRLGAGWNDPETPFVSALEAYLLTTTRADRPLLPKETRWMPQRIAGQSSHGRRPTAGARRTASGGERAQRNDPTSAIGPCDFEGEAAQ